MSNSFNESSTSHTPTTSLPKDSLQIFIELVSELKGLVSVDKENIYILEERGDSNGEGDDKTQNFFGDEADPSKKKDPIRFLIIKLPCMLKKDKKEEPAPDVHDKKPAEQIASDVHKKPAQEIEKLHNHLEQIKTSLEALKHYEEDFGEKIHARSVRIREVIESFRKLPNSAAGTRATDSTIGKKLWEINNKFSHDESQKTEGSGTEIAVDGLLSLYSSKSFPDSSFYNEIKATYKGLSDKRQQRCLLCFAVFSEKEELKKRMLAYWWEGEEFLERPPPPPEQEKTFEELAGEILDDFVKKGLIKPVYKRRRPIARRYRMEPVVRSVIVKLAAEANFFSYDEGGNLTEEPLVSGCKRACLVKSNRESSTKPEPKKVPSRSNSQGKETQNTQVSPSTSLSNPQQDEANSKTISNAKPSGSGCRMGACFKMISKKESSTSQGLLETNLVTIFNVNEPVPDLRLKRLEAEEWLSKMKALKVLSLGNWRASGRHHIEVDRTEFLKGLKRMSSLRLLSLRGISKINGLTQSIKGLTNLRILDLEACHNLEKLPKEISHLQNLTHLDVSDCYMIDHLPRALSHLTNLQVLKGFVVADHKNPTGRFCTFNHLVWMKNLRKLSIIVSKKNFPAEPDFKTFEKLTKLTNLSLLWGADSTVAETARPSAVSHDDDRPIKSFENLKKLDLQCYPEESPPKWLRPWELANLEKLYIRGGKLGGDLRYPLHGSIKNWEWVGTLRLKYLARLKMSWEEMKELFPKLSYLEKVDCPLITMCPCDEDGVWVKHEENQSE